MLRIVISRWVLAIAAIIGALSPGARGVAAPQSPGPEQLIGTWRGTSTCTDRAAAPACNDETVVYDFSIGPRAGTVHWKADKVVNGRREPMGELDLTYDVAEKCWKAQFDGPRSQSVWRLSVDGTHLTGTGTLLPGKQEVRKLDLRKDSSR
jgi:hypothetical protein